MTEIRPLAAAEVARVAAVLPPARLDQGDGVWIRTGPSVVDDTLLLWEQPL